MELAQFQGTNLIPSLAIRWITRSCYSHSAFLFDDSTASTASAMVKRGVDLGKIVNIAVGSTVEAWTPGGVQNAPSISTLHAKGTRVDVYKFIKPLTVLEEERLLLTLEPEIGWPYGFLNVARFITRRPGNLDKSWFCSELWFWGCQQIGRTLLGSTQPWEVPPAWSHRSPLLAYDRTVIC